MKNTFQYLLTLTAVTCLAAISLRAEPLPGKIDDINVVTVSLKLQLQSPGYNSENGAVRVFAKPQMQTLNTKNLLDRLAADKKKQALYLNDTFPGGSKLGIWNGRFIVVKSNNEYIVDVSDIVSLSGGDNNILSGTTNNTTGLADSKTTELALTRFNFDDLYINGDAGLRFFVQGLNTTQTTDSTPNSTTGKYTEKSTDRISNAAGEGVSGGVPFVVVGSLNGSLSTSLTNRPVVIE